MISNQMFDEFLEQLNNETNVLAEELKALKDKMHGRGVYPNEAPIVIARLQNIEDRLRQIGANKERPL